VAAEFAVEIEGTDLAVEAAAYQPVAVRPKAELAHLLIVGLVGAIEVAWVGLVALVAYWLWTVAPW
jgi:hypothetical protein